MLDMFEKGGVGVLESLRGGAGDLEKLFPYPLVPLWWSSHWPLLDEDSDDLLPVNTNIKVI